MNTYATTKTIEIKENYKFELKTKVLDYRFRERNTCVTKIERDLTDDTFDILIERPSFGKEYYPIININNKFQFSERDFYNKTKVINNKRYFRIPSGLLDNTKFSKIKEIFIGLVDYNSRTDAFMNMIKITNGKKESIINLKDGEVAKIKALKSIKFFREKSDVDEISADIKALIYLYKPKKINRLETTSDIGAIYTIDNNDVYDNTLNYGLIYSTGVKNGLRVKFNKSLIKGDKIYIELNNKLETYVKLGDINIIDQTYYDYSKKKTIAENNFDSVKGEIIPYNHKGNYNWKLVIAINSVFDKIEINRSLNFKKPILDYVNGETHLNIENNINDYEVPSKIFSKSDIEFIKLNKEISLEKLKRLAANEN